MLILSRKHGQRVVIGKPPNHVVVTFIDMHHGRCRLGFDADESIPINREEVHDAIQRGTPHGPEERRLRRAAHLVAVSLNKGGSNPQTGKPWNVPDVLAAAELDGDCCEALQRKVTELAEGGDAA